MMKERIIRSLSIWVMVSFFVLLLGITQWDLPPKTAVLYAGLVGLSIVLSVGNRMGGGTDTIEEIVSPDGVVIGTVEAWNDNKSTWYVAKVKRNYQEGVFAKEEGFQKLQDAQRWLATTYHLELEKHQQKI